MLLSQCFANRNSNMLILAFSQLSALFLFLSTTAGQYPPSDNATDFILLDCGASSDDVSLDMRKWDADVQSKFCPFNSQVSPSSRASQQAPSVPLVPYMTARVILSELTCTFPVLPGPKFIRLHFYPDIYLGYHTSKSFFTVTANSYTLLSNFSANLTVSALSPAVPYLFKEFIVTVQDNQKLNLTFTPSPGSFAFINGIEIVSMPANLYTKDENIPTLVASNYGSQFPVDNTTSLETINRLNVGGSSISNINDTGMYRIWYGDSGYIFNKKLSGLVHIWRPDVKIKYTKETPAYTAPDAVYITARSMGKEPSENVKYNLTWLFPVDSGFKYLVRLHFCEIDEKDVTDTNQRVFSIYVNNMTAEVEADIFQWTGGSDIPVIKDYVVMVPAASQSKQNLWLALHPNTQSDPTYRDAILSGIEILKLNNSDGSLAGLNPELQVVATPQLRPFLTERAKRKVSTVVVAIVGALGVAVLAVSLFLYFLFKGRKGQENDDGTSKQKSLWLPFSYTSKSNTSTTRLLPTDICHRFTIAEIRAATRNFDDQNIIGRGGFGYVYKGCVANGSVRVAMKRLDSSSKQGTLEFQTEIEMLSKLRHVHLVPLIGYCDDENEMILVYEYMPHGSLQDHLYKTEKSPLPWKQRLQICIGAARGLQYLHTGAKHTVIHRDVKSSNILLDRNWVAKVSDFGLSKIGPTSEAESHVSTAVKGSVGYLDPEYYRRQQLTEKSDVYSFGVVLLEVLCGRKPIISTLPKEQVNLVDWARKCYQRGELDQIIDQQLKGDILPVSLNKFGEIAVSCVHDKAIERPNMGDIVWSLEFALQLQTTDNIVNSCAAVIESRESSSVQIREIITTDDDDKFTFSSGPTSESRITLSTGERSYSNSDPDRVKSGTVFSEIINPLGR